LIVQLVLHAPVPHAYGAHGDVAGVVHTPLVLQVDAGVSVVPVQLAAMQVVPDAYLRQAPLPLQEPSVPQVAMPWSVHWFNGSCPAGTAVQVPIVPASAHDAHVPVQAVPQQTPCAQKLWAQSLAMAHGWPSASFPQLPLTQLFVVTQSVLAVQVVRQEGVVVLHRYGSHCEVVTARQTPAPSHVRWGVSVDPVHVAAAHCILIAQKRQAPAPLHMPSVPHVVAAVVAHCVAGIGAVPFATLLHVPRLPVIAHDLHVPVHAWLQQYPCAQKPESHSFAIVHAAPVGFRVQLPALQTLGARQSASAVQVVRQAAPAASHLYFPHGPVVAAPQTPAPSHARDDVNVDPVQLAAAHDVPMTYFRQAPAPLQVPSLPQVVAAAIGHCVATSGGCPVAIGEHVPTLPAIEQDMQVPVHALLQQTLLTQKPDAQSELSPDEHVPPTGIFPQLMVTQVFPVVQSAALVVHAVLHADVPH
jgi:hypothetical protein